MGKILTLMEKLKNNFDSPRGSLNYGNNYLPRVTINGILSKTLHPQKNTISFLGSTQGSPSMKYSKSFMDQIEEDYAQKENKYQG